MQCDLADSVHQLIGEVNVTVSLQQFPALAAGSVLYLSSPNLVCDAVKEGRWLEEVQHFLHTITHGDEAHQHLHEADKVDHDHEHEHHHREHDEHLDEGDHGHDHEHIDVHGLKVLLEMLHDHYEPTKNEVSKRLTLSLSAGLQNWLVLLVKVCTQNKIPPTGSYGIKYVYI